MLRISVAFAFFTASSVMAATPTATGDEVVIFLHNAFFEKNKDGPAHQRFGAYDFEGIKAALGELRSITAETFSRVIRQLVTDGVIAVAGVHVTVLERDALSRVAAD